LEPCDDPAKEADICFTAAETITLPSEKEPEKLMAEIRQNPQQCRIKA